MEPVPSSCPLRSVPRYLLSLRKSDEAINRFVFAHCRVFASRNGGQAMRGSLGEKIGEGATADVHAWAPGQVVKLFRSSISRRLSWHEVHMTHTAFTAGAPAPEVFGVVTLEGRFGMVLQHLDGPTLLQLLRSGAMTRGQAGAILAGLCHAVHNTPPPPDVLPLRDWMEVFLQSSSSGLPQHIATGVLALIDRLPPGNGLCHVDPHPGNVIMTAEGPRLVDWSGTVRAPAAYDLGISQVHLTELATEVADDPERPRAVNTAAQSEYARLAGLSPAALAAAIESYLPIVRVLVVLGGAMPALRERLLQRVEAALRSED
jgi:tRNA A-37 threonylcarbamoyl transferase component Bud32